MLRIGQPMSCTVDAVVAPPLARVRVAGELDVVAAPELRTTVARAVDVGCTMVVLDLGDVTFIDCAGVSVLLGCVDDVRTAGADLTVPAVSRRVSRLLELTGTTERLLARRPA